MIQLRPAQPARRRRLGQAASGVGGGRRTKSPLPSALEGAEDKQHALFTGSLTGHGKAFPSVAFLHVLSRQLLELQGLQSQDMLIYAAVSAYHVAVMPVMLISAVIIRITAAHGAGHCSRWRRAGAGVAWRMQGGLALRQASLQQSTLSTFSKGRRSAPGDPDARPANSSCRRASAAPHQQHYWT